MFIIVKYGNNATLLCNPMCSVINLLNSIKRRAGYGNSNVVVDLSDETGLIKELDSHKYEQADKHLASHATYVLVKKEATPENIAVQRYIPLLENFEDMFPNLQIHSAEVQKPKTPRGRTSKSTSPAGRFPPKTKRTLAAAKQLKRK